MVLIIWLFVVLIINSSYTASLTSILTVQQLSPTIKGIDDLISSNLPIGYLTGSFVRNYLSEELNIAQSRLIPLDSPESYAKALSNGLHRGVGAIVDELPPVQLFLSNHCGFGIAGQAFTKGGWGFAFPKGSQLQLDISTAILNLSETGKLQQIHNKWLNMSRCNSHTNQDGPKKLGLPSFWGLFLVSGVAALAALLGFVCRLALQFRNHPRASDDSLHSGSVLRNFASFVDQKEIDQRNEGSRERRTEEEGEINQTTREWTS